MMRELVGAAVYLIESQSLILKEKRRRIRTMNRMFGKQFVNERSQWQRLWRLIPFNEQLPSLA
jgi:hypothetical protein